MPANKDERRRPRRDAPAADQLRELLHINFPEPPCLGEVPGRLSLINTTWAEIHILT